MNAALHISLGWADWLDVFMRYLVLSVLSVGGAVSTVPEMHRYLVDQQAWLSDSQFNTSIAIAQASPGPNILFVALLGWHLGINAGGVATGLFGVLVTMAGILLPSTTIAYLASRWVHQNGQLRAVRAFKQGMAPIVIGLVVAAAWVLASTHDDPARDWPLWLLIAGSGLLIWLTRIHVLWVLGIGAVLGWFGLV